VYINSFTNLLTVSGEKSWVCVLIGWLTFRRTLDRVLLRRGLAARFVGDVRPHQLGAALRSSAQKTSVDDSSACRVASAQSSDPRLHFRSRTSQIQTASDPSARTSFGLRHFCLTVASRRCLLCELMRILTLLCYRFYLFIGRAFFACKVYTKYVMDVNICWIKCVQMKCWLVLVSNSMFFGSECSVKRLA